ncbi:FecR family protein [Thermomonas carbonis]|uniref:FecR domain-containing protein n=1 Tax=Thermomonas carbonis TaxID=1463158 RepID=A0A7G9SSG6_9GAMM|nr:FecR domain-containing protein [Thermomonas carbonis]QNN70791.1 FecR domain-containing protein [Thermomonas carbonis]GHC02445.1 iron dicitrate transporter FecR [Thermomonas carbonis]
MDSSAPIDHPPGDSRSIEQCAAEWLARREFGAWADDEEQALQAWLGANTAHRVAFLRLQAAWSESDRLQALAAGWKQPGPPPRGYWTTPAGERIELAPRESTRSARLPKLAAAAVLVIACTLATGLGWRSYNRVDSAHLQTALGATGTLPLADGSQAILASDSRIDVRLSRKQRHIALAQGEAFFSVAKDPDRPFVVAAGGHDVVAVGTRFSVRRDGPDLRVVVTEGTVRLESQAGGSTRPASLLPAGSVALVRGDDVLVRSVALDDAERLLDWRQGLLAFRDTTLAEAAAEFNRYNARKLVIGDAEAGALRIGGSFRADNATAFVRLLEQGFPVRADASGDRIVLHSR